MKPPKLSLHPRGVYFVKFKGKFTYFSKDKRQSEVDYLAWVQSVWLPAQNSKPTRDKEYTVLDMVELYLSWVHQNRAKSLFMSYRSYLRPLVAMAPTLPLRQVDTQLCEALKQDMVVAGYKPATVNHTLKAIRRMIGWADQQGIVQNLRKPVPQSLPQGSRKPTTIGSSRISQWLQSGDLCTQVWLVLNYLTCARPSEIVRLAHGDGEWLPCGRIFRTRSKVGGRTGYDRFLLFSEEALTWVPHLQPRWSTHDSYGKAVRKLGMGGPRQLRSAGASHLRAAGVSYKDIRVILGHTEAGAVVHYVEEDFSTVLPFLDRLSVLPLRAGD
jgi:site-specific recombinase XerD